MPRIHIKLACTAGKITLILSKRMQIKTHTGGICETNCFYIQEHGILIDAPQEASEWLEAMGLKVSLLLITHGHFDHVMDAAKIKRQHGCKVGYHKEGVKMLTEPDFFKKFGFEFEVEPVEPDLLIEETASQSFNGIDFQVLLVPGHCPGSLCFFSRAEQVIFSGDVLFAGAIGRWDLPGGDYDLLISGIKNKLLPLGDDVVVLPGHGAATKIGVERHTNQFLTGE
jgi:glyoxylase-like metal-dependent hydrolase (beta-lactamase superfamily II)